MRRHFVRLLSLVTAVAAGMTWFYTVHEALPMFIRAPTSLLLTPVALADGGAALLGWDRGVYHSLPRVFLANWVGWAALLACLDRCRSAWSGARERKVRAPTA